MLDAVRVAGRWISKPLLDRLSARAQGPDAPSRHGMLKEFCRLVPWLDRKGKPCLSSANVAIGRLEKSGMVRFPPAAPQKARSSPRKIWDDGLPLSPLPHLPKSVELIKDLRLHLIADAKDPHHCIWNRHICREHPLKDAPLVGAQLRYLIMAGTQVVGAFGFGPSSFYLSCRDSWIGWDAVAMGQNRQKVIGLSRFLIRPGVKCANLASRAYRMVLDRVRADWGQRYAIEPVLVETYVDRSTYTGRSLAAANWMRIGSTQGRGRTSPSKKCCPKSLKDVWVMQWDPKARSVLTQRSLPRVVPRSVFRSNSQNSWIQEELDGLDLGHLTLNRRFAAMLEARWAHPDWSFYSSFGGRREGVAAYGLLANPRADLTFENLIAPHQQNTHRRMAAESVVLLAQDTTPLSYNSLKCTQGLGPIGNGDHPGLGLQLHSLQAFRLDGIPLGCAWSKVWVRDSDSDTSERNQQSIDQKESIRWIEAYQVAGGAATQMPQTLIVVLGDRESDIMDLFDQSRVAPPNLRFLVRAQHDRTLVGDKKLWDYLGDQPVRGTIEVEIPRNTDRPARRAVLELRWTLLEIQPPRVGCKNSWGTLSLWALQAKEIDPPKGAEPIEWVLLSDWKITSLKTARRLIGWYGKRWGIECWHQILKDGCRIETRQMKTAQALTRSLVLDMIIAWRVLFLCRLGKNHPNLPASVFYGPEELAILEVQKKRARLPDGFDPSACPCKIPPQGVPPPPSQERCNAKDKPIRRSCGLTLFQANLLRAMLGGFWGRKSDGHPGPDLMGKGLGILGILVQWERFKKELSKESEARKPSGKDPPD